MQRREFLGIYDLDWPWPVRPDALGLCTKLKTESGVVHLHLPEMKSDGDRQPTLPPEFRSEPDDSGRPESFIVARRYDPDRFRIFGVGIVLWCPPGHESVRVDELRRSLAEVDQWIAWSASEPPSVHEQTTKHLVHLWSPGLRMWRTASHGRFIYQGKGHSAATALDVTAAVSRVSDKELLPLAPRIWGEARAFQARYELRNAVIASATAAEVAIESALYRALAVDAGAEAAEKSIADANGIGERFDLLRDVSTVRGMSQLPSKGKVIGQIAGVRNRAVHAGRFPTLSETRNSIDTSRQLVEATQ